MQRHAGKLESANARSTPRSISKNIFFARPFWLSCHGQKPYLLVQRLRRTSEGPSNSWRIVMRKALIVWGGGLGHQPKEVAAIFERVLTKEGFSVQFSQPLASSPKKPAMMELSLIVPIYTMSQISG